MIESDWMAGSCMDHVKEVVNFFFVSRVCLAML